MNQSSFHFFPFLLNNSSSISNTNSPKSNNKNALLASITAQYLNKNSISIFPFFLTPSKTPPKTKDNKNAIIASIVSHQINNNNLNMFGFFQQLARKENAAKAKAEAEKKAELAKKKGHL